MDQAYLYRVAASAGVALITGLVVTPLVILAARRLGLVAKPRADRWSSSPTALMGGIGIFAAATAGALAALPNPSAFVGVGLAALLIFATGLFDDLRHLRPQYKLIAQIAAACLVIGANVRLESGWHPAFGWGFTLLFVVGITNALNLLDNMDGLAAGVGLVSSVVLAYGAHVAGNQQAAIAAAAVAGACVSFLVYNRHPARVFMGDCGSMFLGLVLAVLAIQTSQSVTGSLAGAVLVPSIALAIPIFDTTFVTIMRKLDGRSISVGGCDHTSHRLVKLGLSENQAVLLLCISGLGVGGLGVIAMRLQAPMLILLGALVTVCLLLLGRLLAQAEVYDGPLTDNRRAVMSPHRLYKKHFLTALMDCLLALSAGLAVHVIFGDLRGGRAADLVAASIPAAIAAAAITLGLAGAYRDPWRQIVAGDAIRLATGAAGGALGLLIAMIVFGSGVDLASEAALLVFACLLALLSGARIAYRAGEAFIRLLAGRHRKLGVRVPSTTPPSS